MHWKWEVQCTLSTEWSIYKLLFSAINVGVTALLWWLEHNKRAVNQIIWFQWFSDCLTVLLNYSAYFCKRMEKVRVFKAGKITPIYKLDNSKHVISEMSYSAFVTFPILQNNVIRYICHLSYLAESKSLKSSSIYAVSAMSICFMEIIISLRPRHQPFMLALLTCNLLKMPVWMQITAFTYPAVMATWWTRIQTGWLKLPAWLVWHVHCILPGGMRWDCSSGVCPLPPKATGWLNKVL